MFSNLIGDGRIGAILAVAVGICLLGLIVIYAWRAFGRGIRPAANRGARQPRLGIVDAFDLDRHRQLVIVRRDNVEHLIMIGGPNDLVIEEAIVRAQPSGSERREPTGVAAPASGEQRQQPPRVPFEPVVSAPPAGQGQAPAVDLKSAHEPATSVAVTPPSLRPSLDQAFGEAVAPPPPLARPTPVTGTRPMPQNMPQVNRPPPPLRPNPTVPRPGAPTLAQRPVTAPAVTPPAPPAAPNVPERAPEVVKEPASEAPKEAPKLTLNIDSLEEEMAKLLGRPVDTPKS
ncbi:MAG: hypothetical protein JWN07_1248 [Hyphomicrobiales bacterium]|nr:hypothetical protein [Hyphomicrobiales bacterium]